VYDDLSDAEHAGLQRALTVRPEAGVAVPGPDGLRKLRWRARGRGKRGGVRIICYWRSRDFEIWLPTIDAKSGETDIPRAVLAAVQREIGE
jgi:hypothetical protein